MTHYRLEPSRIRGVRSFVIALAISCGIVGFVYGGCVWIRDNVFPAPDPIELRHRIEKAGAWPVMHRIAEQVLDGQKPCVDEAGDRALQAAGIKTWFPWIKTGDKTDAVYFSSFYFREPGGILFELASDTPGLTTDETVEELGSHLKLPARFEYMRDKLEDVLPPLPDRR